jgi:glycopeptide antibiotics resistance protein
MRRLIIGTTLVAYAMSVVAVTVLPYRPHPDSYWSGHPFADYLRWVPGDVDGPSFTLNVIMFVPFGILLPLLCRRTDSYARLAAAALSASLAIELLQLGIGLTTGSRRTVDINDLIANTAGALIGLYLLRLAIPPPAHRDQIAGARSQRPRGEQGTLPK